MFTEVIASKLSLTKRMPIYGVGVNDASYITTQNVNGKITRCPYYVRWLHMIERCYSEKFQLKNPSYKGCTVCDEWLVFSNFRSWMSKREWVGMSLDKDLVTKGNKTYSPENCVFISSELNSMLSRFSGCKQPKGVYFADNRYIVQCSIDGVNKEYGRYKTKEDAETRYAEVKSEAVTELAMDQSEYISGLLLKFFGIN